MTGAPGSSSICSAVERRGVLSVVHRAQYSSEISIWVTKKSTAITRDRPRDHRHRRRLADALRAARRPQADVAGDRHDDEPEHERLDEPHPDVLHVEALVIDDQ